MPILLDSGQSEEGWSKDATFMRCPFLFALKHPIGVQDNTEPTTRGTIGHIGQAQMMARWMCDQNGWNRDTYYAPEPAMQLWCDQNAHGRPWLDQMIEVHRRYVAQFPTPPGRILAVEHPVTLVFGTRPDAGWGLWLVDGQDYAAWRPGASIPWAPNKQVLVQPALLDLPGHPKHGLPVRITKRMDLALREPDGREWIWDHKFVFDATKYRERSYRMDGQFAVNRLIGSQWFGDRFGGVRLNLIQSSDPWKHARPIVKETPFRDGKFAHHLWYKRMERYRYERDLSPWDWPMTQEEQTCTGRYGACIGLEYKSKDKDGPCVIGPAGIT